MGNIGADLDLFRSSSVAKSSRPASRRMYPIHRIDDERQRVELLGLLKLSYRLVMSAQVALCPLYLLILIFHRSAYGVSNSAGVILPVMKAKGLTPILNVSDIAASFVWFEKWGWGVSVGTGERLQHSVR